MYTYIEPRIAYVNKTQQNDIIPVFTCREHWNPYEAILDSIPGMINAKDTGKPVYEDFMHYWWIQQTGIQFSIHNVVTCEKKIAYHGEDLQLGNYNKTTYFKGELDQLKKVLPETGTIVNLDLLEFKGSSFTKGYTEATIVFCEVMIDHFSHARQELNMNGQKGMEGYFKGLTVGKSRNIFGFLMQAVKQAYDALGFYQKTYSGLRVSSFGMQDLVNYIDSHKKAYVKGIDDSDVEMIKKMGVVRMDKSPSVKTPPARLIFSTPYSIAKMPEEYLRVIKGTMAYWGKNTALPRPTDTGKKTTLTPMVPVITNEYGFRGDTRSPLVVYYSGGMHPSSLRYYPNPDQKKPNPIIPNQLYNDMPHFDPWLHQANAFMKFSVFLSISIDPAVSWNFVLQGGGNGYIYVIRAVGAVDQAATFQQTMYPEAEISLPGGADWESIIAMRPVRKGVPAKYCYVNLNNRWRAKEKVLQDQAIYKLMTFK